MKKRKRGKKKDFFFRTLKVINLTRQTNKKKNNKPLFSWKVLKHITNKSDSIKEIRLSFSIQPHNGICFVTKILFSRLISITSKTIQRYRLDENHLAFSFFLFFSFSTNSPTNSTTNSSRKRQMKKLDR